MTENKEEPNQEEIDQIKREIRFGFKLVLFVALFCTIIALFTSIF